MKSSKGKFYITSMLDLKKEQQLVRARILEKEEALRKRVQQVPGELFFSGVDSMIPSMLTGKVSNFALNAGKGLINNFLVKKAVSTSGLKILDVIKPSGILKKIQSGYHAITRLKR